MSRMTSRQSVIKDVDRRVEDVILRNRVTELEAEVSVLKSRLTELRKAKNSVIVRREREVVSTTVTSLPRTSGCRRLEKSINPQRGDCRQLLPKLDADKCGRTMPQKENDQLKKTIADLTWSLSELNVKNCHLQDENRFLSVKVQELVEELSVKEAQWCEKEEKVKLELQMNWGDRYYEWMRQTELKIEELQQANFLLRSLVAKGAVAILDEKN